jgi:DNA-binding transcriptional MerR regulator
MQRFWSIGDLAREFEISARTLRFYEDKGILAPIREGQKRKFTNRDRARLILALRGKRLGFSLEEIKDMLDLYDLDGKKKQMLLALPKFQLQLKNLVAQRSDIDGAIHDLEQNIARVEEYLNNNEKG